MRNSDMAYVLKMEYVPKFNIFGLKMMVKSGVEKIFFKFLHGQGLFQTSWFSTEMLGFRSKNTNSVIKMTFFAHGGISKIFCDLCTYNKWNFKPQISSIFNFEYKNEVWINGVLGVKMSLSWGVKN